MNKFVSELKTDFNNYMKVLAVVLALVALFVVVASEFSPIFEKWDCWTYGVCK